MSRRRLRPGQSDDASQQRVAATPKDESAAAESAVPEPAAEAGAFPAPVAGLALGQPAPGGPSLGGPSPGGPGLRRQLPVVAALRRQRDRRAPRSDGAPLPPTLRNGMERLSGADLSQVTVHYDSAEPARLDAHAHTRGTEIFLAPGQQGQLPHEAWHVVQQLRGRAQPTGSAAGAAVSADPALEAEATRMGERSLAHDGTADRHPAGPSEVAQPVAQRVIRGLADLTKLDDIPEDWVRRYLADLTHDHAHLYQVDVEAYLDAQHPGWRDRCRLENTDGAHWDVVFTDGSKPERVLTRADGNCGAHAVSVIRSRLAGADDPGAIGTQLAVAPPDLINLVRTAAQRRLADNEAEVRVRILAEIRDQDFIFLTGFGPQLQAALEERQSLAERSRPKSPKGKSPMEDEHKSSMEDERKEGDRDDAEEAIEPELPAIDVWTLLSLPAGEIRRVVGGYGLRDRKGLAAALRDKFVGDLPAALRLPEDVVRACVEFLRIAPKPFMEVGAAVRKAAKDIELPPAWVELVRAYKEDSGTVENAFAELDTFARKHSYRRMKRPVLTVHELYDHDMISIYPIERGSEVSEDDDYTVYRGPGKGEEEESARKRVHRPILDLEFVGGRFYARCYLGLFAPGTDGRKDITADEHGAITFREIGLMNLGNPFKALLWCEDYLASKEHETHRPDPVVRSFLVPLSSADWMLSKGARPLDQDRGSGQFGNYGLREFETELAPLIGSLVSFFLNVEHLEPEPGQVKLPMAALQEHLTGTAGDPRDMTTSGVAAQHGRKEHEAEFADPYLNALGAYYNSLSDTGFTDATQKSGALRTGRWKKERVEIQKVKLSQYPHVLAVFARLKDGKPTVRWT